MASTEPCTSPLTSAGLALDDRELVARFRRRVEAKHLDRDRRAGACHLLAEFVDQRTHAAIGRARDQEIAELERAALDQCGADRATPALELRLDDDALGSAVGIGGELKHLGLQGDRI